MARARKSPYRSLCWLLAILVLVIGCRREPTDGSSARQTAVDQDRTTHESPPNKAAPTRQAALERFRKLSPQERLQQAEKAARGGQVFVTVARGDLDVHVVERGSLGPSQASDVVCRVRMGGKQVIRWVIDDGTFVKKGDRLVELDDSGLKEMRQDKQKDIDKATADKLAAEGQFKIGRIQNKSTLRRAQISLNQAKRRLKKYAGDDEDEKESLKEDVEVAEMDLEAAKLVCKSREALTEADLKARAAVVEREARRKGEIEEDIAACVIKAPRDGLVMYHVPEATRGGSQPIVAVGEPVRDGQKLLRVCDLGGFTVNVRVHEALIARVRPGQPAGVRVDAFPRQVLRGKVKSIARVAAAQSWLSSDVKVYPVVVDLADKVPGLKPGMSAEVRIEVQRRAKVLRVPVESVVRSGRETLCYVKAGKGLEERKVTAGARNDLFAEITGGLKEGEQVLRAPRVAAGPIARLPGQDGGARVLVRSVRPAPAASVRRTLSESFGLTDRDLERIGALPDVSAAVGLRSFPAEARRLQRHGAGLVVGTVACYRELAGIDLSAGRFLDA
jgi:multidrug resistance efflux pump